MQIIAIPAFNDNYLWLLYDEATSEACVVDPGDALSVSNVLQERKLSLKTILITHHHADHIGGVTQLCEEYGNVKVYGPQSDMQRIPQITEPVSAGSRVELSFARFEVLELPGHTSGHIAYYTTNKLFCGDVLFSGGCGRVFEGTMAQMFDSLEKIKQLPPETEIYCAHEYTASNLRFALAAEPSNKELCVYAERVTEMRAAGIATIPTTLARELAINPFLRCESLEMFTHLREWKNRF